MFPDNSDFHQNYLDLTIRHSITAFGPAKTSIIEFHIRISIFDVMNFSMFQLQSHFHRNKNNTSFLLIRFDYAKHSLDTMLFKFLLLFLLPIYINISKLLYAQYHQNHIGIWCVQLYLLLLWNNKVHDEAFR